MSKLNEIVDKNNVSKKTCGYRMKKIHIIFIVLLLIFLVYTCKILHEKGLFGENINLLSNKFKFKFLGR